MGKKLVITGRGGTGKSTFAALALRFLPKPRLLVDADPDQSLAALLGADLQASDVHTVAEILYDIQGGKTADEVQSLPLPARVKYLLQLSCVYESSDFDLIALGTKWTRGCYCAPNDILRSLISQLASGYAVTIMDSPAGLEHLNRRVLSEVDDVFAVVDPSAKSIRNTEAVRELAESIRFTYRNLYLVANFRFPEDQLARLQSLSGAAYLGRIAHDPAVEKYDWEGRSLLEIPADSPGPASVRRILTKAGYRLEGKAWPA